MTDRMVVLLCGPPGAGKTTTARASGLTVFDRDDVQWSGEREFTTALARLATDPAARAVVIASGASSSARRRARLLVGATHVYLLTADRATLRARVSARARTTMVRELAALPQWHARHDRLDGVPEFPGWPQVHAEGAALGASEDW